MCGNDCQVDETTKYLHFFLLKRPHFQTNCCSVFIRIPFSSDFISRRQNRKLGKGENAALWQFVNHWKDHKDLSWPLTFTLTRSYPFTYLRYIPSPNVLISLLPQREPFCVLCWMPNWQNGQAPRILGDLTQNSLLAFLDNAWNKLNARVRAHNTTCELPTISIRVRVPFNNEKNFKVTFGNIT